MCERRVPICWECEAVLRRIKKFSTSVRNVQKILLSVDQTNLKTTSSLSVSEMNHTRVPSSEDNLEEEVKICELSQQINNNESSDGEYTLASIKDRTVVEPVKTVKDKKTNIQRKVRAKKRRKKDFYRCKECGETFSTRGRYEYHVEKHKERPQCDVCGKTFVSKSTLWLHRQLHHAATSPYTCSCGRRFFTEAGLEGHSECCGARACAACGRIYRTGSGLAKHVRARHRPADLVRYKCAECPRDFDTEEAARTHREVVHMGLNRHHCELCSKEYCTARALRVHIRLKHEGRARPRDKVCEMCGKMFTTRQILDAHRRTHSGEKRNAKNKDNR